MTHLNSKREVVLLNLKWFVNRLPSVFESKLTDFIDQGREKASPRHHLSVCERAGVLGSPILRRITRYSAPARKSSPVHIHPSNMRLLCLKRATSENERQALLRRFATHVCVVYEYQLGMLNGYKCVRLVAEYVADLVIKAVRTGIIQDLTPRWLTPAIFFEKDIRPSSGYIVVKTSPLGYHADSLTWRIADIFTQAGLRHNEVIGESCHNLSIVTHFLSPFTPFDEIRKPELYGYRNVIVCPPKSDVMTSAFESPLYCELFPLDAATVKRGRSIAGGNGGGEETVMLQCHKAFHFLFFLIHERTEVLEHLIECETFAKFCTKHHITPIMFSNQLVSCLPFGDSTVYFPNFDIFSVSASPMQTDPAKPQPLESMVNLEPSLVSAYDNPAFVC